MGVNKKPSVPETDESNDDTEFDMDQLDRIENNLRSELGDDHESVKQMEEVRNLINEYHNADADQNKYGMLLNINSKVSQLRDMVDQTEEFG